MNYGRCGHLSGDPRGFWIAGRVTALKPSFAEEPRSDYKHRVKYFSWWVEILWEFPWATYAAHGTEKPGIFCWPKIRWGRGRVR